MRGSFSGIVGSIATLAALQLGLHVHSCAGEQATTKTPQYQLLPSLREQADIVDAWTEERKALIPGLLRKYGVDAWLVRSPLTSQCPPPPPFLPSSTLTYPPTHR